MTSFSLWLFEFVTLNWIFGVHWVATSLKLFLLQIYSFILKFTHIIGTLLPTPGCNDYGIKFHEINYSDYLYTVIILYLIKFEFKIA